MRGDPIGPSSIARDNRYLISELACKSFETADVPEWELAQVLIELYREHRQAGGGSVTARQLLTGAYEKGKFTDRQLQFDLPADDFLLEEVIPDEPTLLAKIERVAGEFEKARSLALKNTELYLSMAGDLDVYVATSMRDRRDFRVMADFCGRVFTNPTLKDLKAGNSTQLSAPQRTMRTKASLSVSWSSARKYSCSMPARGTVMVKTQRQRWPLASGSL